MIIDVLMEQKYDATMQPICTRLEISFFSLSLISFDVDDRICWIICGALYYFEGLIKTYLYN